MYVYIFPYWCPHLHCGASTLRIVHVPLLQCIYIYILCCDHILRIWQWFWQRTSLSPSFFFFLFYFWMDSLLCTEEWLNKSPTVDQYQHEDHKFQRDDLFSVYNSCINTTMEDLHEAFKTFLGKEVSYMPEPGYNFNHLESGRFKSICWIIAVSLFLFLPFIFFFTYNALSWILLSFFPYSQVSKAVESLPGNRLLCCKLLRSLHFPEPVPSKSTQFLFLYQ